MSDIIQTEEENREVFEENLTLRYGMDYKSSALYWKEQKKCTEDQCIAEMMAYLGNRFTSNDLTAIQNTYKVINSQ